MNKKIFTLLATTLMLLLTANLVDAQVRGFYGGNVPFLPKGMGKGAYHIKVTGFGTVLEESTTGGWLSHQNVLLALDEKGFLKLVNDNDINNSYKDLRETLWCVDVIKEVAGQRPAYNFVNRAYQTPLTVDTGGWRNGTHLYDLSTYNTTQTAITHAHTPATTLVDEFRAQHRGTVEDVFVGGQFGNWGFSYEYEKRLIPDQPLYIEIPDEPDYYMTFGALYDGTAWQPRLVKVHKDDLFTTTSNFYTKNLLRFTLVYASPRVLTAEDFNSTLYTNAAYTTTSNNTSSKLIFEPDVKGEGIVNVLAQQLHARESARNGTVSTPYRENYYMTFQKPTSNNQGDYIYVADGDNESNYYNENNILYPKILEKTWTSTLATSEQYDFRLVYYPSEDSVVINVRGFTHTMDTYGNHPGGATDLGHARDTYTYNRGDDNLFNDAIWNFLTVRMQDLTTTLNERVITVSNKPANTRIHFGINSCEISDDRIAVPRNLYVIRDQQGRYLTMPLELGDFTPQWLAPRNNEDPMKTPSYQWLVIPMNEGTPNSSIKLINREFDWIIIDYVNVYKSSGHYFNGSVYGTVTGPSGVVHVDYSNLFGTKGGAIIYYSTAETAKPYMFDPANVPYNTVNRSWDINDGWKGSFLVVQDDKVSAAKNNATPKIPLTQEEMQKLYRTGSYLGYKYIAKDTISYYTYAFNYLHNYSKTFYLGPKPDQTRDTLLYAVNGMNHFELRLSDYQSTFGTEKYGIGWTNSSITGAALKAHPATKDIAPLERFYYHFKENDYWNFLMNDNFVVLGENARYGFTEEATANARPLEKSAFYLRFTYQPQGLPEYYTLLERVKASTAKYMAEFMGLEIAQNLKVYDESHGGSLPGSGTYAKTDTVGIVVLGIDDNTLYARAHTKVTGNVVSTFSITNATEPLYRRFNEGVYPSIGDQHIDDGGVSGSDDPRVVKIYRALNEARTDYLYEDAHSVNARDYYGDSKGINYLSLENKFDHQWWMNENVGHYPHNFAFYLDTAYVNRGTGIIKPQYMIVVDTTLINQTGCFICGEPLALRKGLYGRYLINATDSARTSAWTVGGIGGVRDKDYLWDTNWERLVFVPAIHIGDSLFILRGGLNYESLHNYGGKTIFRKDEYGVEYLHFATLVAEAKKTGSLIDIKRLDNNIHKDWVFSMRFYEKGNYEKFLLESETTSRSPHNLATTGSGRVIAPMQGGWVKWQNLEMVISRGSYWDAIREAERWNTEPTTDDPVANDQIAAGAVKVFAGEGTVTILNAAGKRVTISNVLGQTVAGAVLTSDNATIAAPKGVLVVAIEGESAVKAVVK